MSEEILRALMQLFALIVKQDQGVDNDDIEFVKSFLNQQLAADQVEFYYSLFEEHTKADQKGDEDETKKKLTSVKDSVRVLGICKKINKTLTQLQKAIVLVRLYELIHSEEKFTAQRKAIIHTVAEVFNTTNDEMNSIEQFALTVDAEKISNGNILIIAGTNFNCADCKTIHNDGIDKSVFILRIPSVDLYFLKYCGAQDLFLNGLPVPGNKINLFANGSTLRLQKGKPIYYSDVASKFLTESQAFKLSFEVNGIDYKFPNGNLGLRDINFSEQQGRLIGIMGSSGAGKTTLLNVLCGNEKPCKGNVCINGIDLHKEKHKLEGVIGLIPQDDLLIEELTVYDNLFYNAKLCFKNRSDKEIDAMVNTTLSSLGLLEIKGLKVGSPLNKTISGGQRKRLNIALELIREPSILFVDEPTSGLSSRDSENVMDLLRELTLKGKLIFVVIHQPSSEIYKMFDKMVILDRGGYLIYYGNPIEAVMYFKKIDAQINSNVGECMTCGNVNPEAMFSVIEKHVVDEYGNYTSKRKVSPVKWENYYKENIKPERAESINDAPPTTFNIPGLLKQLFVFSVRDIKSKLNNTQYVLINMLEAPILALMLSYVIRYIADPNSSVYIFRENENIPIYIFMSIIVALFLGLMVSAEEIFKDRKILKREKFLNLSRSSYLLSKVSILIIISAIQTVLFVLIGNNILGIHGMTFSYWFALFTTAVFANMLGLNVSSTFNSAINIYIIIPLLMIPMMVLSGAMFSFDKLNRSVGSVDKVPLIADMMTTKWTYEAMLVRQFKDNEYQKHFYDLEKEESYADFRNVYYIPELKKRLEKCYEEYTLHKTIVENIGNLKLLRNEIQNQTFIVDHIAGIDILNFEPKNFNEVVYNEALNYLLKLEAYYNEMFSKANLKKQNVVNYFLTNNPEAYKQIKDNYSNEYLTDIVKKSFEKNKILEYDYRLVQQIDPIFLDPRIDGKYNFRSHFLAPRKYFAGAFYDTFWFNMLIIWLFTFILYITLYFELFKKLFEMKFLRFKKED